jgi:tetratricopeptide (TPR) repeat protein
VSPLLLLLFFAVLAIQSRSEYKLVHLNVAASGSTPASKVPVLIIGLPIIAGVIYIIFIGSKVLTAESTFAKSLDAVANNDAKLTYDLMNSAINQNPKVDRYHASFAQVNMALASSLASKKDITDKDRSAVSQLVQQAISEGKATVALNSQRSGNWEVLAQIYRSIMPYAKGADQFTIQTYQQAIALDPTNPNLRIALGGVYYSLGNFDAAIDSFKLAVIAKPNLANAHYNLAIAYREKKDYTTAIAEVNNVLSLVAKDSADYTLAKQTLTDLQSKNTAAKASTTEGTENLTPPKEQEKSNIKPPIDLPKEATPPASIK